MYYIYKNFTAFPHSLFGVTGSGIILKYGRKFYGKVERARQYCCIPYQHTNICDVCKNFLVIFPNQLPQQLIRILRFFSVHFASFSVVLSRIEFVSLIKFPLERMMRRQGSEEKAKKGCKRQKKMMEILGNKENSENSISTQKKKMKNFVKKVFLQLQLNDQKKSFVGKNPFTVEPALLIWTLHKKWTLIQLHHFHFDEHLVWALKERLEKAHDRRRLLEKFIR